ncbi:MAG: PspC domain-containing protein [Patescibacteria group bacterium]
MKKIISIHLNGKSYQIEEDGHSTLTHYLERASASLRDNPDKQEILTDLEQSIGDKFSARLHAGKDVITEQEIKDVLEEMGPVEGGNVEEPSKTSSDTGKKSGPKKLYLIREGAMIGGVCTGLAAYFDIDVVIVRAAFILLTLLTGGGWILVYIVLMFVVPRATTPEAIAAAYGEPFNAKEVVDRAHEAAQRAKATAEGFAHRSEWRQWRNDIREQRRMRRREYHDARREMRAYAPFFGIVRLILGLFWLSLLFSLVTNGMILGWHATANMPLWVAIILLFLAYHIVVSPIRAMRYSYYCNRVGYGTCRYDAFTVLIDLIASFIFIIFLFIMYTQVPAVYDFVNAIPVQIQAVVNSTK